VSDFTDAKAAYADMPADQLSSGVDFQTRAGWKNVPSAEALLVANARRDVMRWLRGSPAAFRAFNAVLLATGAAGIVLLCVGLIATVVNKSGPAMGLPRIVPALPTLRTAGGATVLIGSFGFVIYNSLFLWRLGNQLASIQSLWSVPGAGSVLYHISLALSILSSVEIFGILAWSIFSVVRGKAGKSGATLFWSAIGLIFLGPLIASAVGVSVSSAINGDLTETSEWYHSSNSNLSATVSGYVNEFKESQPKATPGPICTPRPGTSAWDFCGCDDYWFGNLSGMYPGSYDFLSTFEYAYSLVPENPPWGTPRSFKWDSPPGWDSFYFTAQTTGCYWTTFNNVSIERARTHRDLCELKLDTIGGCGPGWTRALFNDILCSQFRKCVADFNDNVTKWDKLGAENDTGENDTVQVFQLPSGWNSIDLLEGYLKQKAEAELTDAFLTTPKFWLVFNAVILAVSAVGWLLLVVGIIAGSFDLDEPVIPETLATSLVPAPAYE
jgi:hypothetical protein